MERLDGKNPDDDDYLFGPMPGLPLESQGDLLSHSQYLDQL